MAGGGAGQQAKPVIRWLDAVLGFGVSVRSLGEQVQSSALLDCKFWRRCRTIAGLPGFLTLSQSREGAQTGSARLAACRRRFGEALRKGTPMRRRLAPGDGVTRP